MSTWDPKGTAKASGVKLGNPNGARALRGLLHRTRAPTGTSKGSSRKPSATRSSERICGLADDIEHEDGVREHGDVAAGDLAGGSGHAIRHEALQLGMDSPVPGGQDVPTRLRSP